MTCHDEIRCPETQRFWLGSRIAGRNHRQCRAVGFRLGLAKGALDELRLSHRVLILLRLSDRVPVLLRLSERVSVSFRLSRVLGKLRLSR